MKIREIKIGNYKCFPPDAEPMAVLDNINLFIGKNNSGKSTVLEVLKLFFDKCRDPSVSQTLDENVYSHNRKGDGAVLEFRLELSESELAELGSSHLMQTMDMRISGDIRVDGKTLLQFVKDNGVKFGIDSLSGFLQGGALQTRIAFVGDESMSNWWKERYPRNAPDGRRIIEKYIPDILGKLRNFIIERFMKYRFAYIPAVRQIKEGKPGGEAPTRYYLDGSFFIEMLKQMEEGAKYKPDIVRNTLKNELKKFPGAIAEGTDIKIRDTGKNLFEISFTSSNAPEMFLSMKGAGLMQLALLLTSLRLIPIYFHEDFSNFIFGIEEPENNLHPEWQKIFIDTIREYSQQYSTQFFVTTHSPLFMDYCIRDRIFLFTNDEMKGTKVKQINTSERQEVFKVIDSLGFSIGNILQRKGIVYTEGPTDCNILKVFFEKLSKDATAVSNKVVDTRDYMFLPLGGNNMRHIDVSALIYPGQKIAIALDSEKKSEADKVEDWREKLVENARREGLFALFDLNRRSIENFLTKRAICEVKQLKESQFEFSSFTSLEEALNNAGRSFSDKPNECRKIAEKMTLEEIKQHREIVELFHYMLG